MQKVTSLIKEVMEILNYLFDASELNIEIRNKQITQKQQLNADLNEQNQLELAF
jgi:hypothetical protein